MGSSRARAQTRFPCIGRQILNHCATREALTFIFNYIFTGGIFLGLQFFLAAFKKCHSIFWLPFSAVSFIVASSFCFPWVLLRFSLSLVVRSLSMMYLGMIFFVFTPHRVHRASCMCSLMSLVSFGKFSVSITSTFASYFYSHSFWNSKYTLDLTFLSCITLSSFLYFPFFLL